VLINEYRSGQLRIAHVDLYRIEDPAELAGVGLDDAWSVDTVALVEWAERASTIAPAERLQIAIEHLAETKRLLRLTPAGTRYEALVAQLTREAFG
jgi:tRNA threonylcarbamoyladenosine biosynthesis protein TsaE